MMGFMIYFVINMRFFKIFKVFLKSGPSLEKSGKMGKNGEKRLSQNPHYPTTCINSIGNMHAYFFISE